MVVVVDLPLQKAGDLEVFRPKIKFLFNFLWAEPANYEGAKNGLSELS